MFTNFTKFFYNLISEGQKFSDLPDQKPYGFWIDLGGGFWIVPYQQHENTGIKIINNNPRYKQEYTESPNSASAWLIDKGFIRVTIFQGRLDYNSRITPNRSQSQTIMDLSEFYGLRPENANVETAYQQGRVKREYERQNPRNI